MSNGNGKSADITKLDGVWALLSMTDGSTIIGKFLGLEDRERVEKYISDPTNTWVALENAYNVLVQPATNGQGMPIILEICMPYFQALDDKQSVSLQIKNICASWFVDEMNDPMQAKILKHVNDANKKIGVMRAAAAGIQLR